MIFIPDDVTEEWEMMGFTGPRHPCFLCGNPVGEGEVANWMGSIGGAGDMPEPEGMASEILKALGPVTRAGNIFFHPRCIPTFCRRILEDWERVK